MLKERNRGAAIDNRGVGLWGRKKPLVDSLITHCTLAVVASKFWLMAIAISTIFASDTKADYAELVAIPGTPGFCATLEGWGTRGEMKTLTLLIPQKSYPKGAGKVCISSGDKRTVACTMRMGPYGQQWDAPMAFYFQAEALADIAQNGSLSIFSEAGELLADFDVELGGVIQLLRK